jgi:hypothetical protein
VTDMYAMFEVRLILSLFGCFCAVVFDSSGWCLGPVIIHMCVCVCSGISVSVFVCVWLCGWVVVVHMLGVVGWFEPRLLVLLMLPCCPPAAALLYCLSVVSCVLAFVCVTRVCVVL